MNTIGHTAEDLATVYSEARARYYDGKKVGWDNWAEIEEAAHKFALLSVCSSIIDKVQAKVNNRV